MHVCVTSVRLLWNMFAGPIRGPHHQVIGVFSRAMCALMVALPPRFSIDSVTLADSEAARRFTLKPQTFIDALYLAQKDLLHGFMAAPYGFMHDAAAGE